MANFGIVLALLRPLFSTTGLVIGARGLSRSVENFVSDCAEKGSIIPERFGLSRGRPGPRYDRALGRVSLLGVARVRHAALTAATGSKQRAAGHSSSTGMREGENAWGSTGDRAQGRFISLARELRWCDPGLAADLRR